MIAMEAGAGPLDAGFTPYRHLAIRVLARALLDVSTGSASDREGARLFFAGSRMLFHWCRVAAVDPRMVAECAAGLVPHDAPRGRGRRTDPDRS